MFPLLLDPYRDRSFFPPEKGVSFRKVAGHRKIKYVKREISSPMMVNFTQGLLNIQQCSTVLKFLYLWNATEHTMS